MVVDLNEYVLFARVGKAHGIKGEVRIFLLPGMPDDLSFCQEGFLKFSDSRLEKFHTHSIRPQGKFFVVKFRAVNNRDEAELLTSVEMLVHSSNMPESVEGHLYWHEYEGLTVWTDAGEDLGSIKEIFATGAHDIMVVTGKGREFLIPIIDDIIVETDLASGKVVIAPMPGLLDINS